MDEEMNKNMDAEILSLETAKRMHDLEEQNKFLMKRENKLQQIETMFKNGTIDLSELSKLVLESEGKQTYYKLTSYIEQLQQENNKIKQERNCLMETLFLARNKYKRDKGKYRQKAKIYRIENKELKEKDYNHFAYLKRIDNLEQENKKLKERIETLKELDLYTCEADYDYEENLELNYVPFSMEEL